MNSLSAALPSLIAMAVLMIFSAFFSACEAAVLFIYRESLPKSLILMAPNKLLHLAHPLGMFLGRLFVPMSVLLWGLGPGTERLLGRSPVSIQLVFARRELKQVFTKGTKRDS